MRVSLSARRAWIEIDAIAVQAANSSVSLSARRAWIEICPKSAPYEAPTTSLSARRAWIEISGIKKTCKALESLSARRAWIEIFRGWTLNINGPVALRKESVDRNGIVVHRLGFLMSRSPQGERG